MAIHLFEKEREKKELFPLFEFFCTFFLGCSSSIRVEQLQVALSCKDTYREWTCNKCIN